MPAETYERYRDKQARTSRSRSESGRDIGPLADVLDPERRNACLDNFKLFCETYFAGRFQLRWSRDHLVVIETLQRVVIEGGQFALAMPRGSGKTTLATTAVLFAVLYGHRRFVVLVASTSTKATQLLTDLIRDELELNSVLAEDFPEVCQPARALERNATRARMQTLDGEFTRIGWSESELVLPTVTGSQCSGARIVAAGLAAGDIRGLLKHNPDGSLDRPDLVICDDPQTDESARSPMQCNTREALLGGAILGLAGPGKKIAAVVPCTIIRPGDLSDRILDRKRNPEWQGKTFRLVDSMPSNLEKWAEYGQLLRQGFEIEPPDRTAANDFYAKHQDEMDAGAVLSWPERDEPGVISALQYAMDLYILKPAVFAAEYQNRPLLDLESGGAEPIDPTEVREHVNTVPRGVVPAQCSRLVAFIDPHQEIIVWSVVGFDETFGPAVVDYGTFPHQHGSHFSRTDPTRPLSEVYKASNWSMEARLYAGLTATAAEVLGKKYARADEKEPMAVELCLVDVSWGEGSETIHQWIRQTQTPHATKIRASRGRYVGAARTPFSVWKTGPGDRKGPGWMMKATASKHGQEVLFDANLWKSFLAERSRTPMGSPGCLTVFGSNPAAHNLFADHLAAEYPKRCRADDRTVDEWQLRPGGPDNDYLDCLVACCVAASVLGLRWDSSAASGGPKAPAPPRGKTMAEMQKEAKAARQTAGGMRR